MLKSHLKESRERRFAKTFFPLRIGMMVILGLQEFATIFDQIVIDWPLALQNLFANGSSLRLGCTVVVEQHRIRYRREGLKLGQIILDIHESILVIDVGLWQHVCRELRVHPT